MSNDFSKTVQIQGPGLPLLTEASIMTFGGIDLHFAVSSLLRRAHAIFTRHQIVSFVQQIKRMGNDMVLSFAKMHDTPHAPDMLQIATRTAVM